MSQDMKRKLSPETQPKRRGVGMLVGLFVGLVLGISLAAAVAWYTSRSTAPFVNKTTPREKSTVSPETPTPSPPPQNREGMPPSAPGATTPTVVLPGKPGESATSTERRFQFYDILQGKTEAVPAQQPGATKPPPTPVPPPATTPTPAPDPKPAAQTTAPSSGPQPTYLQAAAVQKSSDAEGLRARLAMNGLESTIQQVTVQDKTWFRVRVGPYTRPEEINRARQELTQLGLEAVITH